MKKFLFVIGTLALAMSSAVAQDEASSKNIICSNPKYQSFGYCTGNPNVPTWGPASDPQPWLGGPPGFDANKWEAAKAAVDARNAAKASEDAARWAQARAQRPENKTGTIMFLNMATAYNAWCEPLSDDVLAKVKSAYQSLNPDEQWLAEHRDPFSFGDRLFTGSKADLENRMPATRQQFQLGHNQQCAGIGNNIAKQAAQIK